MPITVEAREENLRIWNELKDSNPTFLEDFTKGRFTGKAINPCYIVGMLTEVFGPCGVGWRFVLDDEKYIEGEVIQAPDVRSILHVVRGHLDYFDNHTGMWASTGPQYGQTKLLFLSWNNIIMDEEAPKKSITDCLGKCAALLGQSADVYLKHWDSNKYINDSTAEARQKFYDDKKAKKEEEKTSGKPAGDPSRVADKAAAEAMKAGKQEVSTPPADAPKWDGKLVKASYNLTPEQWAAYIDSAQAYSEMLGLMTQAAGVKTLINKVDLWRSICQAASNRCRVLGGDKEDPDRKSLIALLQEQRKVFDEAAE